MNGMDLKNVTDADGGKVTPNAYRFFSTEQQAKDILAAMFLIVPNAVIVDETAGAQKSFKLADGTEITGLPGGVGTAYISPEGEPKIFQIRGTAMLADGVVRNLNENVGELLLRQETPVTGDVKGGTQFRLLPIGDTDVEAHWTN